MEDEKRRYEQITGYIEEVLHDRHGELAAVLQRLNQESPRLQAGKPAPAPITAVRPATNR
jgi:hypothetical protein